MCDPSLPRRRRRQIAVAYAWGDRRVLLAQLILPTLPILAVGALAGWYAGTLYASDFFPTPVLIAALTLVALLVALVALASRASQGRALHRHVRTVTGPYADALLQLDAYCARLGRFDRFVRPKQILWDATARPDVALQVVRALHQPHTRDDVRVLQWLQSNPELGVGEVTMIESMLH